MMDQCQPSVFLRFLAPLSQVALDDVADHARPGHTLRVGSAVQAFTPVDYSTADEPKPQERPAPLGRPPALPW